MAERNNEPVIVSIHPRTRNVWIALGWQTHSLVRFESALVFLGLYSIADPGPRRIV